ncbi:MAG: hypothetical protein RSB76_01940 [Clostridia bacterium]
MEIKYLHAVLKSIKLEMDFSYLGLLTLDVKLQSSQNVEETIPAINQLMPDVKLLNGLINVFECPSLFALNKKVGSYCKVAVRENEDGTKELLGLSSLYCSNDDTWFCLKNYKTVNHEEFIRFCNN